MTTNGSSSDNDRPSSPYDVARSDTLAQKSTLSHLMSQPGPWDNDQVFVSLRPELEGLIFKYNSYNVTRRPRPATPDSVKLAGPSQGSTLAYARSAQQQRSPTPAQSSSSPDSYVLESRQTVVRRYSDFVWLNEILVKRYPFRIVPILPPKRLTIPVAGRHLSSDEGFMERRRRGLQRYLRALIAHPILGRDELVQIFLTEKQVSKANAMAVRPLSFSHAHPRSSHRSHLQNGNNHTTHQRTKKRSHHLLNPRLCSPSPATSAPSSSKRPITPRRWSKSGPRSSICSSASASVSKLKASTTLAWPVN